MISKKPVLVLLVSSTALVSVSWMAPMGARQPASQVVSSPAPSQELEKARDEVAKELGFLKSVLGTSLNLAGIDALAAAARREYNKRLWQDQKALPTLHRIRTAFCTQRLADVEASIHRMSSAMDRFSALLTTGMPELVRNRMSQPGVDVEGFSRHFADLCEDPTDQPLGDMFRRMTEPAVFTRTELARISKLIEVAGQPAATYVTEMEMDLEPMPPAEAK